jgi:hypothetical protein
MAVVNHIVMADRIHELTERTAYLIEQYHAVKCKPKGRGAYSPHRKGDDKIVIDLLFFRQTHGPDVFPGSMLCRRLLDTLLRLEAGEEDYDRAVYDNMHTRTPKDVMRAKFVNDGFVLGESPTILPSDIELLVQHDHDVRDVLVQTIDACSTTKGIDKQDLRQMNANLKVVLNIIKKHTIE